MKAVKKLKEKDDIRNIEAYDKITMTNRARYLPRWMELSEVSEPDKINFDLAPIRIEWLLCDPRNLALISGGKRLPEFLDMLTEEQQEFYYYYFDDDGRGYRELENPKVMKQINRALKMKMIRPIV